jgi:hypothetical protein
MKIKLDKVDQKEQIFVLWCKANNIVVNYTSGKWWSFSIVKWYCRYRILQIDIDKTNPSITMYGMPSLNKSILENIKPIIENIDDYELDLYSDNPSQIDSWLTGVC